MSSYRLFISARSPFARRIRMALTRLGIPFETEELDVFKPTPELMRANPLGLVPVLQINGETNIPDSATILEFLHENHGEKIWPSDLKLRAQVRAASTLAEGIMASTVAAHLERVTRQEPSEGWLKEHQETISRTLGQIHDQSLFKAPWADPVHGPTQAGWDLMVALDYLSLRWADFGWQHEFPDLMEFYLQHSTDPVFKKTAPPPA